MRLLILSSRVACRMCIACIVMSFVVSCATTQGNQSVSASRQVADCMIESGKEIEDAHYVVVDDHGRLGAREFQIRQLKDALNKFKALGSEKDHQVKKRTILIYVHGGLTSSEEAIQLGKTISSGMQPGEHFPLFFIWRTGGLETYWEQSARVRDGERFDEYQPDTPLHWVADLGQGIVRAPLIYVKQVQRVVERGRALPEAGWKLNDEKDHYERMKGPVAAHNNLIFTKTKEEGEKAKKNKVDDHHVGDADMFWYVLASPFRTLASPLTDGLGRSAWENMVRRARTTVHQTAEFDPVCRKEIDEKIGGSSEYIGKKYSLGLGGFSEVFNALDEWLKENDGNRELFRITLIGHSMGAIVLNELIRTYDDVLYDDIVYMGAAASIRDLNRVIVPYLRRHPPARFYNLMLHPLNEAWELTSGGILPSGSLLEWVDEMYEPPETMLDRTVGKWRNVRLAKHTVDPDVQEHMVFKVFDGSGDKPRRHGHFNDADMCFWNPWFWVDADFNWEKWNRPEGKESEQTTPPNSNRQDSKSSNRDWNPPELSSLWVCWKNMSGK